MFFNNQVLHFTWLSVFAWLFVEVLHVYRRLTEVADVDRGAMKFYYVLGWVVPGIVVGLAVGLETDKYGNADFCWLRTDELVVWAFVAPALTAITLTLLVSVMAAHAGCREKVGLDPDHAAARWAGVKAAAGNNNLHYSCKYT